MDEDPDRDDRVARISRVKVTEDLMEWEHEGAMMRSTEAKRFVEESLSVYEHHLICRGENVKCSGALFIYVMISLNCSFEYKGGAWT